MEQGRVQQRMIMLKMLWIKLMVTFSFLLFISGRSREAEPAALTASQKAGVLMTTIYGYIRRHIVIVCK
jgi:hypothetical protein